MKRLRPRWATTLLILVLSCVGTEDESGTGLLSAGCVGSEELRLPETFLGCPGDLSQEEQADYDTKCTGPTLCEETVVAGNTSVVCEGTYGWIGACCTEHWQVVTDDSVDGVEECGPDDGACISGTFTFTEADYGIASGDIGEVFLLPTGNSTILPIQSFVRKDPPNPMPFKFANLPPEVTACRALWIGGRVDSGGNTQGNCCDAKDVNVNNTRYAKIFMEDGCQVNGVSISR